MKWKTVGIVLSLLCIVSCCIGLCAAPANAGEYFKQTVIVAAPVSQQQIAIVSSQLNERVQIERIRQRHREYSTRQFASAERQAFSSINRNTPIVPYSSISDLENLAQQKTSTAQCTCGPNCNCGPDCSCRIASVSSNVAASNSLPNHSNTYSKTVVRFRR